MAGGYLGINIYIGENNAKLPYAYKKVLLHLHNHQ